MDGCSSTTTDACCFNIEWAIKKGTNLMIKRTRKKYYWVWFFFFGIWVNELLCATTMQVQYYYLMVHLHIQLLHKLLASSSWLWQRWLLLFASWLLVCHRRHPMNFHLQRAPQLSLNLRANHHHLLPLRIHICRFQCLLRQTHLQGQKQIRVPPERKGKHIISIGILQCQ